MLCEDIYKIRELLHCSQIVIGLLYSASNLYCLLILNAFFGAGQIKMGFSIIANAFKSKVKALEEDLRAVHEEKQDLEGKVREMINKLQSGKKHH